MNIKNHIEVAKEVFEIESKEIANLSNLLTDDFEMVVEAVMNSKGKFIISGMGKSGIVGRKIAATLASTGTSSFFLHPGEAYHGDLGMIGKEDVVLLISNSGETDEVLKIIPFLRMQGNTIIAMSGNPKSTMAKNSDFHLNVAVLKEACPLQLAPTSSTTAALVMGDAIAVALMKAKNFQDKDFAQYHPGGSLGRRLLTKVKDIMHTKELPICSQKTNSIDVIHNITSCGLGLVVVCDNEMVIGVITDGDIRKAMEKKHEKFFSANAEDLMTKTPLTINEDLMLTEAQQIIEGKGVNSLIVTNNDYKIVGIVTYKELVR